MLVEREVNPEPEPSPEVLEIRKKLAGGWHLPEDLFGSSMQIWDFQASDYINFLNKVGHKRDLVRGLTSLTPFTTEGVGIARDMTKHDFKVFKKALIRERETSTIGGDSRFPQKWVPIIVPGKFLLGYPLAEELEVALGVALIRIEEVKVGFD